MLPHTSIFTRLLLLLAVVMLVGQGLAAWQGYTWAREGVIASEGERAQAAATALALALDGTAHEAMATTWPERDAFTAWDDADESARALHRKLAMAQHALGLTSPIYTLRLRDDARRAVVAAPDQAHPLALEFLGTSAQEPNWRHSVQYLPAMRAPLLDGRPARTGVYATAHGDWVSGYAPVRDIDGAVVALLEVDAPLAAVLAEVRVQATRQLALAVAVFLGVLIAVGSITRRLSVGIRLVEGAVARVGEGDLTTRVVTGGLTGVGGIAQALEAARIELRRKLQRLSGSQSQLAERLAEAEAETGGGTEVRKRRSWLVEHRDSLKLTLGAGKSEGHSARLVDLDANGLLVRVPVNAPVDLPRGSVLGICLKVEGRVEPLVLSGVVKQRSVIDQEAALRLGVEFSSVLDALPPAVLQAIGPRRALRVCPAREQAVQLAIRGRSDADAVQATVLHVSVNGAGVRVDVPAARVAAWRHLVRIGVAHAGSDGMVSSYAEIVRVQFVGSHVILGLSFLEPDIAFERSLTALVQEADRIDMARATGRSPGGRSTDDGQMTSI
jgi:hypothetical protein